MPLQLIFTSAPQGLAAGRSGFCTVARHREMPDRLAQLLESLGTPHASATGETFTFRSVEAGGSRWLVLSRFVARGLDYTRRDNRLAHHLVFRPEETAVLPPPAAIAYRWKGWKDEWTEQARWLDGADRPIELAKDAPLTPATAWREETGTGSKAAWLVKGSSPAAVCLLNAPSTARTLRLLAESSALLGEGAWSAAFTTDAGVTGGEGFDWCVGHVPGRADTLDLSLAASLPAPTGPAAKAAAMGTAASQASGPAQRHREPARKESGPSGLLIGTTAVLLLAVIGLGIFFFRTPEAPPAPPPPPPPRAPTAQEMAKADEIMRANSALGAIEGLVAREEFVDAAKLWLQSDEISPEFSRRHATQHLPGLRSKFAAGAARKLSAELDRKGLSGARELLAQGEEALTVGARLEAPKDAAWDSLRATVDKLRVAAGLFVRPVTVIQGVWETADGGPNAPSQADFQLSPAAADAFSELINATTVTKSRAVDVRLRIVPLEGFHRRDETKFIGGEIRKGGEADWIEARPEPGRLSPITVGVGKRAKKVSLQFADGRGADRDANRLLEIELPGGELRAFALIGSPRTLRPSNLGIAALIVDPDTKAVRAAPWAEAALNAFVFAGGGVGLYPDGHEFPDRDLPSVKATRSLLETDLIRLERATGPSAPPQETVTRRRQLLEAGDTAGAGAPWTLRAVDARGQAGPALLEFR